MNNLTILITGANGEMGHGLIEELYKQKNNNIIAMDLNQLDNSISGYCTEEIKGDILNNDLIDQINNKYSLDIIFHLAAKLSSSAEQSPIVAHEINVNGTLNVLNLAIKQARIKERTIKFFFPSSIAVYGFNKYEEKIKAGQINEKNYINPQTIYGCNKLYCENLGNYFSHAIQNNTRKIDFRSIRFPGIISSQTIPTSGTSDYIPEMLHAAAKGISYNCFVDKYTQIPFMTMPDAIQAIIQIMQTPKKNLKRNIYNIRSFAPTAEEFRKQVIKFFPSAKIGYSINNKRQMMVDGWPLDTDDSAAKEEWGWSPNHTLETAFKEYFIPNFTKIYNN